MSWILFTCFGGDDTYATRTFIALETQDIPFALYILEIIQNTHYTDFCYNENDTGEIDRGNILFEKIDHEKNLPEKIHKYHASRIRDLLIREVYRMTYL